MITEINFFIANLIMLNYNKFFVLLYIMSLSTPAVSLIRLIRYTFFIPFVKILLDSTLVFIIIDELQFLLNES